MSNKLVVPPNVRQWAQSIGGLIINFGGTELLTLRWIAKLKGDQFKLKMRKEGLSDKVTIIQKSIPGSQLSEANKAKLLSLLSEVAKNIETRNRIAHNALCFLQKESTGEFVLSPIDTKKMEINSIAKISGLSIFEIANVSNRIGLINGELIAILNDTI
jgi:hypothetical protein